MMGHPAHRRTALAAVASLVFGTLIQTRAGADDWPTYQHDSGRSGVSPEQLPLPLQEVWVYRSSHGPRPAWPPPAKRDIWHRHQRLRPVITFDRAFHVVVADGMAYFGSSADDKVYCLDAATG
ncbi:MAG: PQQ-binding-like beta-propeller repeat protein, partial [Armatimonadota bacterium]